MALVTESDIEQLALNELQTLGWKVAFGPDVAPDGAWPERESYSDVVLKRRLRDALERINPDMPPAAVEEALRKVLTPESPALIENNRSFHKMLTDGVDVSWMGPEGKRDGKVWLLDIEKPENNDWLAVNQFTVIENKKERRPDIILFVNGLPLVVIELKNPGTSHAAIHQAFKQIQTYKQEISSLFLYNEVLAISDGIQARFGTLTSGWDRFMPWRTIDGTDLYREPGNEKQSEGILQPGMKTLIRGMFEHRHFLDYVLNFVTFEEADEGTAGIAKKAAGYHQYHAVNQALASTLIACGIHGDAEAIYARFTETVPIYYESRLAKIELDEKKKPRLDAEIEEITEAEEDIVRKERLKSRWASLEALVGTETRIRLVAKDLVQHWQRRQEAMLGKGMIVCMSRRICVEMYKAITELRPEWHSDDDTKGKIKVVMTGSASDPPDWQPHIRNKTARKLLARRFKDPNDELELVIVRDMWLTGFDAPPLHTMYVDKPMGGHNLMQAIARVNRVFRDKPGGLVVDYLGIANSLKKALAFYDALASNDSAVQVLGDQTLKKIAQELVEKVRKSVTVDWSRRENARAQLRVLVKRILRKYGYPPDKQEQATELVLEQTEVLCEDWTTA